MRLYISILALLMAMASLGCKTENTFQMLTSFEKGDSLGYENIDSTIDLIAYRNEKALKIRFHNTQNPKVVFTLDQEMDWNNRYFAGDFSNPSDKGVQFFVRVDSGESSDGLENTLSFVIDLPPGASETVLMSFQREQTNLGMKEFNSIVESSWGDGVDLDHITAFHIWQWNPHRESSIIVDNLRLIERKENQSAAAGIVDRYGQYTGATWKGKIHKDKELHELAKKEKKELSPLPDSLRGRNMYGGWKSAPVRQEATGYFRTQKINGKWRLIDPLGYPYFSIGMDIIRLDDMYTMVSGREEMFAWLPGEKDPLSSHYSYADYVLEGPVNKGRTYSFYQANLERKYGENWRTKWKETALKRTLNWGFTSLGNWSDPEFWGRGEMNRVPYVADGWIQGDHRRISSGNDYWGEMHDPFDPAFKAHVRNTVQYIAGKVKDDPWCMGIFIDNELSWGSGGEYDHRYGIIFGALRASEKISPAKQFIVSRLKEKYETIAALNASWNCDFQNWERISGSFNGEYYFSPGMVSDLSQLLYLFGREYYRTVHDELEKALPHHLYLGSRMPEWSRPDEVVRAASEYCDILSFNIYSDGIRDEDWTILKELDHPGIIGEFHFGAKDSGMFGSGIRSASDQTDRGSKYKSYIKSVLANQYFVGAHWFQYVDQPLTGRAWDGENYNIGFVSVTDTPYASLVEAAREINMEIYKDLE